MYFLASPMYRTDVMHSEKDPKKHERNADIAKALERAGIRIMLPQRDIDQNQSAKKVLQAELKAIKDSQGMIVILSDTRGIYLEAGYAKALGKKIYGLKVKETRELSKWGHAFFDYVVDNVNDLIDKIKNEADK